MEENKKKIAVIGMSGKSRYPLDAIGILAYAAIVDALLDAPINDEHVKEVRVFPKSPGNNKPKLPPKSIKESGMLH